MKPPASTPRRRLLRVALLAGGLLLLMLGYGLFYIHAGFGLPCPLYRTTGLQCPGCGMTRALAALLRGEVAAAFGFNLLWPLFAAYLLWGGLSMAVTYIRRGEAWVPPGGYSVHWGMLVIMLLYGILRNLSIL